MHFCCISNCYICYNFGKFTVKLFFIPLQYVKLIISRVPDAWYIIKGWFNNGEGGLLISMNIYKDFACSIVALYSM